MINKKTVYFHIGTHKTGSTALQKFFVENVDVLFKKGISYANYNDVEMNQGYLVNADRWQEIDFDKSLNHIISGEDFYKKIIDLDEVVSQKLSSFDIQFIIYLKRQDLMKQSVYNQIVKMHGYYKSIEEDNHYDLDYYEFLKELESKYPKAGINVRVYEKSQFEGGSIYADFFNVIGLELTNEFVIPEGVVNPSLTRDKLEFCRYINMLALPIGLRTQINKAVVKAALESNEVELFRMQDLLAPALAINLLSKYEKINYSIAREYLGREDGRLFLEPLPNIESQWKPYPGLPKGVAKKIVEEINQISPDVLRKLISYLEDTEYENKAAKNSVDFIMPLVFLELGEEIRLDSLFNSGEDVLFSRFKPYVDIVEKINPMSDSADILREVALAFERDGDIETAFSIMKKARDLRPNGPFICEKVEYYAEVLK